jgi:hypothetical protein
MAWVDRTVRVLKDHLDPPVESAPIAAIQSAKVFTAQPEASSRRQLQANQQLAHRRLAATGLTDKAQNFAWRDSEVHAVDSMDSESAVCGKERTEPRHEGIALFKSLSFQHRFLGSERVWGHFGGK